MIKLTTIKRAFLAGIIAVSMLASSVTALAASTEEAEAATTIPHIDASGTTIVLPITQTFSIDPHYTSIDQKVTYMLTPETVSPDQGFSSNTQVAVDNQWISFRIGDAAENVGTFELDGDAASTDITLTLNRVGFYAFRLSVTEEDKTGYRYDRTEYLIRVYHKNSGTSFVTVERLTDNVKVNEIAYHHVYIPIVVDDPPVRKEITGGYRSLDDTFRFTMELVEKECENPDYTPSVANETAELTVQDWLDGNTAEIGDVTFTEPGTFTYRIYEVKGDIKGYTYDENIYYVTYKVTLDPDTGMLTSERTITYGEEPVAANEGFAFRFTNKYTRPTNPGTDDGGNDGGNDGGGSSTTTPNTPIIRSLVEAGSEGGLPGVIEEIGEIIESGSVGGATGDASNMMLYAGVLVAAALCLIGWLTYTRKNHNR